MAPNPSGDRDNDSCRASHTVGETGHRLGRKALAEMANVARPDTILACYRKMVAANSIAGPSRAWSASDRPKRRGIKDAGTAMIEPNEDNAVGPTQRQCTTCSVLLKDIELMPKD